MIVSRVSVINTNRSNPIISNSKNSNVSKKIQNSPNFGGTWNPLTKTWVEDAPRSNAAPKPKRTLSFDEAIRVFPEMPEVKELMQQVREQNITKFGVVMGLDALFPHDFLKGPREGFVGLFFYYEHRIEDIEDDAAALFKRRAGEAFSEVDCGRFQRVCRCFANILTKHSIKI